VTVKQLIKKLEKMPKNAIAVTHYNCHDGEAEEIDEIYLMDEPAAKVLMDTKYKKARAVFI
jgi:hypothetical protein